MNNKWVFEKQNVLKTARQNEFIDSRFIPRKSHAVMLAYILFTHYVFNI